jgi:hypothetical protein
MEFETKDITRMYDAMKKVMTVQGDYMKRGGTDVSQLLNLQDEILNVIDYMKNKNEEKH